MPLPTYPLYTAVLAKIGREDGLLPHRSGEGLAAGSRSPAQPDHAAHARAGRHRSEQSRPAPSYPRATSRALLELAEQHNLVLLADEVYGDLALRRAGRPLGSLNPDAPVIAFSSLSKAYLAPGWRAGWMVVGRTPRLDDALAAIKKLADGRLCSPGPMQYAVTAALTGDRSHQAMFRAALGSAREADDRSAERDPGHVLRRAARRVLRDALGDAAAGTHRRGLRPRPAARDRRPLRLRLGLRHESRGRLLPDRLPGAARRAREHLRRHRRRSPPTTIARRDSRPTP